MDTINLEAEFMTPTVALREYTRCLALGDHFAAKADDRCHPDPVGAARLARDYRLRAERLRQIAQPTAPRVTA